MKIFDKRPLSLILCMLLGGFVFFSGTGVALKITITALGALLLLFALFAPLKEFKGRVLTAICAVAILIGSLFSFLYFDLYYNIADKYDGEVEITGTVTRFDTTSYGREIAVEIETVNSQKRTGRTVIAFATLDESENISEGSRVTLVGEISSLDSELDEDTAAYYRAAGYSAIISEIETIYYVEHAGITFKSRIINYRAALCRRIIANSNEESGGLLCALLLGERGYLSSETRHDFARVGMSHMLALSGMHLAIITFALEMFLSRLGVMKKPRKIVQIIFVLMYMALTGFPASVMRAGIMLIVTSLLFLLSRRADSITTLFIAVTVILVAEPYAAFDIGLWLSAFATLGILLFFEFYDANCKTVGKVTLKHRLFRAFVIPVIISVFAFTSTFLLNAVTFKSFSFLAPITTPIYSIAAEIYMYLGIVLLVCGGFLSLGSIVRPVGEVIIGSVRAVSSIKGIYISADFVIVTILLIVLTVALLAFAVLDIKRKRSAVLLLASILLSVFVSAVSCAIYSKNADVFDYTLSDTKEWVVMQDGGTTTLLDITMPSTSTASLEIEHLQSMGLTEIDNYVFTSYSARTPNAISKLLGAMYIDVIYLPAPQNEDELALAERIISENAKSKSTLEFYQLDQFVELGEFSVYPGYRSADTNKFALTIHYRDQFYTYLSSGMLENDTKNVALPLIEGCNTLILGRHGNSYSNYNFIYQVDGLKKLVVSSKNLTIPSETARYYDAQMTNLYYSPERLGLYVE